VFERPDSSGPFVLVLVGATIVGSMATTWHGIVNNPRAGRLFEVHYEKECIEFKQGEEMGRFLLGSTVVMLFPKRPQNFNVTWQPTGVIRLGEEMANQVLAE
jgi:phosphatidylserine decarboxylase